MIQNPMINDIIIGGVRVHGCEGKERNPSSLPKESIGVSQMMELSQLLLYLI